MTKPRVTALILGAAMTVLVSDVAMAGSEKDAVEKAPPPVSSQGGDSLVPFQRNIVEHAIKMLDSNQDGKISRGEYMVPYEKRFDREDTDRDGFLTREEYIEAWTKLTKRMDEEAKKKP